jgi:hypothetical protein
MKGLLLAPVFFCFTQSALAEWVKLGELDDATLYTDITKFYKNGNVRRVWFLEDLKAQHEGRKVGIRSIVYSEEYDCKARTYRKLSVDAFSVHMADSKESLSLNKTHPLISIEPDTKLNSLLEVFCR